MRAKASAFEQMQETERRVTRIVDLMAASEWDIGRSGRALAKEWGVSRSRVSQLAAEASRIIRRAVGEPKDIKKMILAGLQQVTERTLDKGEYRTYIEAVRTIAGVHGLIRDRLEISKGPADFEGWTEDEMRAYVERGEWPARFIRGGQDRRPTNGGG